MKRLIPLYAVLILLTGACSGERTKSDAASKTDTSQSATETHDSLVVITLPTPLQIPALLKNHEITYFRDIVLPPSRAERPFFEENILLGMRLIDLSYVSVFNDGQEAIRQMEEVSDLGKRLGIATDTDNALRQRFENNLQNQDSLGHLILEFYERGHFYFSNQQREGVGLLIVLGCYLEGMYFTFRHVRDVQPALFFDLIRQQSLYAENLRLVLDNYQFPPDIEATIQRFLHIHQNLQKVSRHLERFPESSNNLPSDLERLLNDIQVDVYWVRNELGEEH